ncbi:hypothetical protein L8C07_22700 [Paenibacillus sp. CMAA1739]|nr:hypothetical protein [Paenibacillus sp. CMAA1739]
MEFNAYMREIKITEDLGRNSGAMTHIGKEGIRAEEILKKLNGLSLKREPQDKLLGNYKVGDLAIATILER